MSINPAQHELLDTQPCEPATHSTGMTTTPAESQDETGMHSMSGIPPDAVILAPTDSPPMCPQEYTWGLLVVAVDLFAETAQQHRAGEVALFAAQWLHQQAKALPHDGDVVIRLAHPEDRGHTPSDDPTVDVDLLVSHQGQWKNVGHWVNADNHWPRIVAPVAASIMDQYADGSTTTVSKSGSASPSPARFGLRALISSGLLRAGELLVCDRPNLGDRYTARITVEGRLVFPDGRTFGTPGGAMAALGKLHQNGWILWRRESDGRLLSDLRAECLSKDQATLTPGPKS